MRFTKMQGCGNDYVYVNCFQETVSDPVELAIRVSDRHFGIGSDGLILIRPSDKADFFMDMYNLDGSRGRMCGNGIRCVGKYVYDHKLTQKTEITVETLSGIKYLTLIPSETDPSVIASVTVNMGSPADVCHKTLSITEDTREFTCVSMGNPHAVTYVTNTDDFLPNTDCISDTALLGSYRMDGQEPIPHTLEEIGPRYECHEVFPERSNIEFVRILNRKHISFRVWERGSGETFACGTGACASAYASFFNGYTDSECTVSMRGGDVVIRYDKSTDSIYMTGPAVTVFEGELYL